MSSALNKCFAYVFMRHIFLPPDTNGAESLKNEWLKVEVEVKTLDDRTVVVYPSAKIPYAASAVILDNGTLMKWQSYPKSYNGKIVSDEALALLDSLAWDIREMRCKDCPTFPWAVLMDVEMINMRVEDHYGSYDKMERFYSSSQAAEINADLLAVGRLVVDVPTPN